MACAEQPVLLDLSRIQVYFDQCDRVHREGQVLHIQGKHFDALYGTGRYSKLFIKLSNGCSKEALVTRLCDIPFVIDDGRVHRPFKKD